MLLPATIHSLAEKTALLYELNRRTITDSALIRVSYNEKNRRTYSRDPLRTFRFLRDFWI